MTRKNISTITPPKFHMDTQNDRLEKVTTPFKHGKCWYISISDFCGGVGFCCKVFFSFYLFSGCFFWLRINGVIETGGDLSARQKVSSPQKIWCWRVDASNSENGFFFSTKRDGHDCVTSCRGILPTLCFFCGEFHFHL